MTKKVFFFGHPREGGNPDPYVYIMCIFKDSSESGERKYIVDIVGGLPVILMELNNSGDIVKTYIYANSQIIAQHTGDHEADRYFYLHDRLGSVRQVIDTSGNLENSYTYDPFGEVLESDSAQGAPGNAFMFTGQYFDSEIEEYYLRARQYDPHIARFTARDPVFGRPQEPLTLHKYLYCLNDPLNRTDPTGETAAAYLQPIWEAASTSTNIVLSNWPSTRKVVGPISLSIGTAEAGFHTLHILYLRSLQHMIMNVILYEDLGVSEENLLPVGWELLFGRD
ncbi:MAG: RHS repeat-associated core domain-containing protein [Sedimentisphaerales bacterium]